MGLLIEIRYKEKGTLIVKGLLGNLEKRHVGHFWFKGVIRVTFDVYGGKIQWVYFGFAAN